MSEIQLHQNQNVSVFSTDTVFKQAEHMGSLLAASTIVPKDYQNNLPNCVVAMEIAYRLNVSPLMVMQNTDIIHGKPAPKATFIIALVNDSKKFAQDLEFEYSGAGDDLSCYAYTKRKDGREVKGPTISIKMAKAEGWYSKSGSKWPNMTETMLAYRAASFFSRIHCPNVTMGMQSADEIFDIGDVNAGETVINEINSMVNTQPAAEGYTYEDVQEDYGTELNNTEVNEPQVVQGNNVPPPPPVVIQEEDDDF